MEMRAQYISTMQTCKYGTIRMAEDEVVKVLDWLNEDGNTINGCTISETALATSVCSTMPGIINIKAARCVGEKIELCMERGVKTLCEFVRSTRFHERMKVIDDILRDILIGVGHLHKRGIVHCDLNPTNIVLCKNGDWVIIDMNCARFADRAEDGDEISVNCSCTYAAPEALLLNARPTFALDAYSVGVILHFIIYGSELADPQTCDVWTHEDALKAHLSGKMPVPDTCPDGVDPKIFDIMRRLLHVDPDRRANIIDLVEEYFGEGMYDSLNLSALIDKALPADDTRDRDHDIDALYDMCSTSTFPLAVSIRDRSGATGKIELAACAMLAVLTLFPDTDIGDLGNLSKRARKGLAGVERIINRLGFSLYSDTAEWILKGMGVAIDPERLRDAIKEARGDTTLAVQLYRKRRVSDGGESPAPKRMAL